MDSDRLEGIFSALNTDPRGDMIVDSAEQDTITMQARSDQAEGPDVRVAGWREPHCQRSRFQWQIESVGVKQSRKSDASSDS